MSARQPLSTLAASSSLVGAGSAAGMAAAGVASAAQALLAVLEAQEAIYRQLQALADERLAALVAADVEALSALIGREQPLLAQLSRLEAARLQAVGPWAAQRGVPAERLTMAEIVSMVRPVAPAMAERLEAMRRRLLATAEALQAANRQNADLLQACLDSVNASIYHLLQVVQLDPRYSSEGKQAGPEAVVRLTDYRA